MKAREGRSMTKITTKDSRDKTTTTAQDGTWIYFKD